MFIAYITAGYPDFDDTVNVMLSLQDGGADIIELGTYLMQRTFNVIN